MANYPYTVTARFWSKVDVTAGNEECWNWRAAKNAKGYGRFKHRGYDIRAHRMAWEMANGERLGERVARHTCDNPSCCNPLHIIPGTVQDNVNDMMDRGRHRRHARGSMSGENNPNSKLTDEDVREIRKSLQSGDTISEIADRFEVSYSTVHLIEQGRTWGNLVQQTKEQTPQGLASDCI